MRALYIVALLGLAGCKVVVQPVEMQPEKAPSTQHGQWVRASDTRSMIDPPVRSIGGLDIGEIGSIDHMLNMYGRPDGKLFANPEGWAHPWEKFPVKVKRLKSGLQLFVPPDFHVSVWDGDTSRLLPVVDVFVEGGTP